MDARKEGNSHVYWKIGKVCVGKMKIRKISNQLPAIIQTLQINDSQFVKIFSAVYVHVFEHYSSKY